MNKTTNATLHAYTNRGDMAQWIAHQAIVSFNPINAPFAYLNKKLYPHFLYSSTVLVGSRHGLECDILYTLSNVQCGNVQYLFNNLDDII